MSLSSHSAAIICCLLLVQKMAEVHDMATHTDSPVQPVTPADHGARQAPAKPATQSPPEEPVEPVAKAPDQQQPNEASAAPQVDVPALPMSEAFPQPAAESSADAAMAADQTRPEQGVVPTAELQAQLRGDAAPSAAPAVSPRRLPDQQTTSEETEDTDEPLDGRSVSQTAPGGVALDMLHAYVMSLGGALGEGWTVERRIVGSKWRPAWLPPKV